MSEPSATARAAPAPVVILGTVALNGGDAALLEAEIAIITAALGDAPLVVFDQNADAVRHLRPDLDVRPLLTGPGRRRRPRIWHRIAWLARLVRLMIGASALARGHDAVANALVRREGDRRALTTYLAADTAFTPAGTMLVEQHTALARLVDYHLALTLGCRLVVFTQTIGGLQRRIERRLARKALGEAAAVFVRGDASRARALELGANPATLVVAPDPVFAFASPVTTSHRSGRVGISVREWPYFRGDDAALAELRYEAAIGALCSYLVEDEDRDVVFVSSCQGTPEYRFDDSEVAARIASALPSGVRERATVDREYHAPHELADLLGDFDLVVATRLHAAILALNRGTPVVAVAYEPKTREVFERLGALDCVVDIEDADAETLRRLASAGLSIDDLERQALHAAVMRERAAAEAIPVTIREALGGPTRHRA